jgi:hypothetical protein
VLWGLTLELLGQPLIFLSYITSQVIVLAIASAIYNEYLAGTPAANNKEFNFVLIAD